jgi:hypothetical protein
MPTITPTQLPVLDDGSYVIFRWTPMANGDDGSILQFAQYADRSVQVFGTFGAGGTLRWEGSNDGTNFTPLTDPQGNALDFTTAKMEAVTEVCAYARPRVTAGDGTTSLSVVMLARRPTPNRQ